MISQKNFFLHFNILDTIVSVEHDEKPPQPEFDMNWFMGGGKIWRHEYLISPIEISVYWPCSKHFL